MRPGAKRCDELLISDEATGTTRPRIWQVGEDSMDAHVLEAEHRNLEEAIRGSLPAVDARRASARRVAGYSDNGGGAVPAGFESGREITPQ